jgi:hypothetical protein
MALVKCKECGAKVSNTAKACPKCGAPDFIESVQKNSSRIVKYGGAFVAVVILGSAMVGTMTRQEDPNSNIARATAESIRTISRDPDSVKIEKMLITPDGSTKCVQYQAKNGFGGTNREFVVIFKGGVSKDLSEWASFCPGSLTDYAAHAQ